MQGRRTNNIEYKKEQLNIYLLSGKNKGVAIYYKENTEERSRNEIRGLSLTNNFECTDTEFHLDNTVILLWKNNGIFVIAEDFNVNIKLESKEKVECLVSFLNNQ